MIIRLLVSCQLNINWLKGRRTYIRNLQEMCCNKGHWCAMLVFSEPRDDWRDVGNPIKIRNARRRDEQCASRITTTTKYCRGHHHHQHRNSNPKWGAAISRLSMHVRTRWCAFYQWLLVGGAWFINTPPPHPFAYQSVTNTHCKAHHEPMWAKKQILVSVLWSLAATLFIPSTQTWYKLLDN